MPQHAAGPRIEPPVSLPSVAGENPAATAAAEPDEEPAGEQPPDAGVGGPLLAGGSSGSDGHGDPAVPGIGSAAHDWPVTTFYRPEAGPEQRR